MIYLKNINQLEKIAELYPFQADIVNEIDKAKAVIDAVLPKDLTQYTLLATNFYAEVLLEKNFDEKVSFLTSFAKTHKEYVIIDVNIEEKLEKYLNANLPNAKIIEPAKYFASNLAFNYPSVAFAVEPVLTVFKIYAQNTGTIKYSNNNQAYFCPVNSTERSLLFTLKQAEEFLAYPSSLELSDFAYIYDEYMQHVNYKQWVDLLLKIYNKHASNRPQKVLELACGTATIAIELSKRGLTVDASDISSEMLVMANKKPAINKLWQACMTDELDSSYDLIVLLFDSINYLEKENKILQLFDSVKNALTTDGLFIFDISTAKNCEENFDGFMDFTENDKGTYIQTAMFNSGNKLMQNEFIFFNKHGLFNVKTEEKVVQHIYPVKLYKALIKKAGLNLVGIFSTSSSKNLIENKSTDLEKNNYRLFFAVSR